MDGETRDYQTTLSTLYRLQKFGIKFGLSQTRNLLEALGHPEQGERFVHIAGTNGKGSVSAFLAGILQAAGYKTGLYTSPHLVRFTERFRVGGTEISRAAVVDLIQEIMRVTAPQEPPTFFEAVTAMALVYFKRCGTDLAIMEVGMGGRLDATNIIDPLVTAITNISLEHRTYLGKTLRAIAGEKAGIIKPGVPVVTAATQQRVLDLFEETARAQGAPFYRIGRDINYRRTAGGLAYYGRRQKLHELQLGLLGTFQDRNAALALALAEILQEGGWDITEEHLRAGLAQAKWPGRMQVVATAPTIVLDGAHNPAAMRHLAAAMQVAFEGRRLILVIGIMDDKDLRQILAGILPLCDYAFYTRPAYARAAEPERLMAAAGAIGPPGRTVPTLPAAIDLARGMARKDDVILICGSLFTVGEALVYFDPQNNQPDPP